MTDKPIRPRNAGITQEAAEALARQGMDLSEVVIRQVDDTSSDVAEDYPEVSGGGVPYAEEFPEAPQEQISRDDPDSEEFVFGVLGAGMSTGDIVDAQIVGDEEDESPIKRALARAASKSKDKAEEEAPRTEAKTGPPTVKEWQHFFGKVVLRFITDFYINMACRGIPEDSFSDRELERLAMTDEERSLIAVPFAELSSKSKFMRKHGRAIVASGDAINAVIVMGTWMSRVNRIAARHKTRVIRPDRSGQNGHSGQGTAPANGYAGPAGAQGGRFADGFNGYVQPGSS